LAALNKLQFWTSHIHTSTLFPTLAKTTGGGVANLVEMDLDGRGPVKDIDGTALRRSHRDNRGNNLLF
jgi:hypothetical protein